MLNEKVSFKHGSAIDVCTASFCCDWASQYIGNCHVLAVYRWHHGHYPEGLACKTQTTSDFYTAGGGISGFQNGLAIAGDYISAASFLGIAGMVYVSGFDGIIYAIGFYLVGQW